MVEWKIAVLKGNYYWKDPLFTSMIMGGGVYVIGNPGNLELCSPRKGAPDGLINLVHYVRGTKGHFFPKLN